MINKIKSLKIAGALILAVLYLPVSNGCAQSPEKEALNKGVSYYKYKMYKKAIAEFNKAIEINPNLTQAYYNRGIVYMYDEDFNDAISDFNKTIELNPKLAQAYYNRGFAYAQKDDIDQAISDCSKAIELNPNLADAYYGRAMAYFLKQEYDKSWEDVHKAETLGAKFGPEFLERLRKASKIKAESKALKKELDYTKERMSEDHPLLEYDIDKLGAFDKEKSIENLGDIRESDKLEVLNRYNAEIKHLELQMQSKTVDPFTGQVVHTGMTEETYYILKKALKEGLDSQLKKLDEAYDKKIQNAENADLYQTITDRSNETRHYDELKK